MGLVESGYGAVGAGFGIGAVDQFGAVGWGQRSGAGEAGVAAVVDGGEQVWPVGTPMDGDGEHCERQEPHGSQPW